MSKKLILGKVQFEEFCFSWNDTTHRVFHKGNGPAVIIMHEQTGMTPECIQFANMVVEHGFTVFLPLLYGKPGERSTLCSFLRNTVQICLSREFYLFKTGQSSPITDWLKALCQHIKNQFPQHSGIGLIGMCFTGGFVLSMMVDEAVLAPVICQPALPFSLNKKGRADLSISFEELLQAKNRAKETSLLALRFEEDWICPSARFQKLQNEFEGHIEVFQISSHMREQDEIPRWKTHSVLTHHFADKDGHAYQSTQTALEKVLIFLKERLFTQ
jgi:dienelactone hydrolase